MTPVGRHSLTPHLNATHTGRPEIGKEIAYGNDHIGSKEPITYRHTAIDLRLSFWMSFECKKPN